MKFKLHHILVTSFFMTALPCAMVHAQDAGAPIFDTPDPEVDRERERVMYSPGEGTTPTTFVTTPSKSQNSILRDSSAVKMPAQKVAKPSMAPPKATTKPKDEDDSILSFNFLYYIIEKYKLQDIVD